MADPSIKKTLKADGLSGACDRLKMNVLSKNLFLTMAENGRVTNFEGVINTFHTIMSAHRGEVICEVTTAKVCGFFKSGKLQCTWKPTGQLCYVLVLRALLRQYS